MVSFGSVREKDIGFSNPAEMFRRWHTLPGALP
jgi:hypothetical protein